MTGSANVIALNSSISALLVDGDTFDRALADRLIELLPLNTKRRG